MSKTAYQAWVVEQINENQFAGQVQTRKINDLPDHDVLIRVHYSSLNYKDALSATGNRGVTKTYPHTPGIDAAGIVEHSRDPKFQKGDPVIVTSYDLGMNTPGGFGQYIRVPADWVVQLPSGLTLKQSMILGTAGFTAAMSVDRLIQTVTPDRGDILVTGATGGVGSLAVGILSHLGFRVTAVTGKKQTAILDQLGAAAMIDRQEFLANTDRPLLKERWAGVVDTVGGPILAAAIKATQQGGIVTCCGNVASPDLPMTVFPFILRGISLMGIDSQHCPMEYRQTLWNRLASDWKFNQLEQIFQEIRLDELSEKIKHILNGKISGRTLVNLE
ncbi:MAG: YhdH/YhfP family quinone oxidoreductase [Pseudomonadota bacterium]